MREFVKFEILRNIKKKEVKIMIFIVILCEVVLMLYMNNKAISEDVFSNSDSWYVTDVFFDLESLDKDSVDKVKQDVIFENEQLVLFERYKNQKDWIHMYKSALDLNLYNAQIYSTHPTPNDKVYFRNKDRLDDIRKEFGFISIESYKHLVDNKTELYDLFTWVQHDVEYFYNLYKNNFAPMTYSQIDSSTVLIQLLRNLLTLLIPILTILLFYNDRKEYHDLGIDKTMMIIPNARRKFVFWKIISNSLLVIGIIFIPILCFTLILGIFDHFSNFNYPLYANSKGITQINFSYWPYVEWGGSIEQSLENGIMQNYGMTYTSANMQFNPDMNFITIWQGVILIAVLLIFLIIFYVQLNILLSRLLHNSYFSLVINVGIIVLLSVCSPITSMDSMNIFNPLTYRDPGLNLLGTSYYPWLLGMMILVFYNIILFGFNKLAFKYKYYG